MIAALMGNRRRGESSEHLAAGIFCALCRRFRTVFYYILYGNAFCPRTMMIQYGFEGFFLFQPFSLSTQFYNIV